MKKHLSIMANITALVFVVVLLGACSSKSTAETDEALKQQSEKRTQLIQMQIDQMRNNGLLMAALVKKDDCSFNMETKDGQAIENLAAIKFTCNNGGNTAEIVKVMNQGSVEVAKAMAYQPKTAGVAWAESAGIFFDKGFGWAITATPWLATYGITKQISSDYKDINDSNNKHWSKAVGDVAENGGSTSVTEIRETTTLTDTSTVSNTSVSSSESIIDSSIIDTNTNTSVTDVFVDTSDTVNNSVTDTSVTNNTSTSDTFTDTFGTGNDLSGSNWHSFNTDNYNLDEPAPPAPPAP